ncbi:MULTISPECIES: slipin family protein [Chryseobacterium]|uniref:slipin family protein n=2 Tax=Chryseobacterium group TaxID=2782232 RepID=UPI001EF8956A|nr:MULTISPECIES: slipin family protein [Chryseobacterium]MBM7421575.1 regulator of protease activity HflC (stomatin/prohibitin superfamily) [Chryseobacterium sp. JUb44]MDH6211543.1 regulator of protease activity HflC (stomatin/prohibitin superfamily) [Chryseobacterium sp. BIGb0186]WSO10187.1 slipin family protein [Chryseobacterium scophthalmum]
MMVKNVQIKAYQVGLVFKNRNLITILKEGNYWLFGNKSVEVFETKAQFKTGEDLNLLLKNTDLASMIDVVEVKDGEIVLVYENGIFKEVLNVGQYAFWKGVLKREFQKIDLTKVEITEKISKTILENLKLKSFVRKFVVPNQYKGLLLIDGKLTQILEAGTYYFWNNETSVETKTIDTRMQQMEIAGQELLTKDKAMLRINFYVCYQVEDVVKALMDNKEYDKQLYILMQLALREFVGALTLDELLVKKDSVGKEILENLGKKAEDLGLKASDAGIRDVILTGEMKEIMNQVLIAEKKAQANSIMRREETASTRSLLNTAKLMEENETLWKLKEMEYMEKIAEKIGDITVSGNSNIVSQLKEIFAK